MTRLPPMSRAQRGFTLLELLAAMAVVSILSMIAMSSYSTQTRKAHRTEAKTALMDIASREESLYSTTNTYSATPSSVGYTGAAFPVTVGNGYYQVNVVVTQATATAPATYQLTATPLGSQVADTACASFGVNQLGVQSASSSTGANALAACW